MLQGNFRSSFRKLFVGGLSHDTTDKSLRTYFERFGKVASAEVLRDHQTLNSRGFGFVTFLEDAVAIEVINAACSCPHIIDGKQVEVKIAVPRDSQMSLSPQSQVVAAGAGTNSSHGHGYMNQFSQMNRANSVQEEMLQRGFMGKERSPTISSYSSNSIYSSVGVTASLFRASSFPTMSYERQAQNSLLSTPVHTTSASFSSSPVLIPNKLFVGGLLYVTGHESLKRYFESFGEVDAAEVIYNRDTKKSRGFGFVIFKRKEAMEAALFRQRIQPMIIDGKQVEVKMCKPREECMLDEVILAKRTSYSSAPETTTHRLGSQQIFDDFEFADLLGDFDTNFLPDNLDQQFQNFGYRGVDLAESRTEFANRAKFNLVDDSFLFEEKFDIVNLNTPGHFSGMLEQN